MSDVKVWHGAIVRKQTPYASASMPQKRGKKGRKVEYNKECPKCGEPHMAACSPSGLGIAACDACGTYWEEGAWLSEWTAANLAQCRVGWEAFASLAEAEAHQDQCSHPSGVRFDPGSEPGDEWTN